MSARPILLIGAHGQLGRELARSLAVLGPLHALGRAELDLTDADAIARVVDDVRPGLIVNAAAYTAVDRAESEPELAFAINARAPGLLAEAAARLDGALLARLAAASDATRACFALHDHPGIFSRLAGALALVLDHLEVLAQHVDRVAVVECHERCRDLLAARAVDRAPQSAAKRVNAADVVAVMVGH